MPNGHELGRWHAEDQLHQHQSHYHPHGRHVPSFIPPQVIVPAQRGFWSYIGRSFWLLVCVLVFFLIIVPWIIALLSLLWAPVTESSNSTVSFFDSVNPELRAWLPTGIVVVLLALAIGAAIRVLRKI